MKEHWRTTCHKSARVISCLFTLVFLNVIFTALCAVCRSTCCECKASFTKLFNIKARNYAPQWRLTATAGLVKQFIRSRLLPYASETLRLGVKTCVSLKEKKPVADSRPSRWANTIRARVHTQNEEKNRADWTKEVSRIHPFFYAIAKQHHSLLIIIFEVTRSECLPHACAVLPLRSRPVFGSVYFWRENRKVGRGPEVRLSGNKREGGVQRRVQWEGGREGGGHKHEEEGECGWM